MSTKNDSSLPKSDRQSQALHNIEAKLQQAIASWKKQLPFTGRLRVNQLPWLFLLGATGSGKTSLLANSGLTLSSSHSSQIDASKPTRSLQFWAAQRHLLVDIPGDWHSADDGSEDEQRFHHLLELTSRYHKKQAPTQVLQVLDFNQLASADEEIRQPALDCAAKQLQFMHDWNPAVEINLVINKADCIPGFQAFFSHLSSEQKNQPCGLGLSYDSDQPILDGLKNQLDAFADQINAQTISKLHRERSLKTRDSMKDFPFQVQRLLDVIYHLLENLPVRVIQSIKGVYLTSCEQSESVTNLFADDNSDPLPIQITTGSKPKQQVFFVRQLFANLVQEKQTVVTEKIIWRGEYNHIVAGIIVLAAATFALHVGYNNSKQKLTQLSESLVAGPTESIKDAPAWLNQLNKLEYVRESLTNSPRFDGVWFGLTTVRSLRSDTDKAYHQLLDKPFRDYVFQLLSTHLADAVKNQSANLFYDLATYLRMTQDDPSAQEIVPWFNQLWSAQYPDNPAEVNLLLNNLTQLLNGSPNYAINTSLVGRAQAILAKSPPSQILFMMLATRFSQTAQPVDINQPAALSKPMLSINPLYTVDRYNEIVNTEIPKLAKELTQENWVLNRPIFKNLSPARRKQLINSARDLYLTAFSQNWRQAFNQLNIDQNTDMNADLQLSAYLSSFDSGLWQKLQSVLNFLLSKDELNINEKKYWADVREHLANENNQKLLVAALKENSGYIRKLLYSNTPEQSAFEEAKKRMGTDPDANPLKILLTLGKISPLPIKNWLSELSGQSWKHMLQLAANYVNAGWQTTIYSDYSKYINNRFPIFRDGDKDITIQHFNAFFGVGGSVQQFYGNYLNGFVNTNQSYWTLKELDGQKLPIERSALDAIIRGSLIQKMFYQNNKKYPSFGFGLTPITLSHGVQRFILNVGGQMYTVTPNNPQPFQATWPGPDGNFVTMRFVNEDGKKPTINKSGPWAWLRLLAGEQVKPTNDASQFTVVFDVAGSGASFRLTADNRVNPYLPGLLDGFRLSDNLTVATTDSAASQ
jgi:type VI secretion system protein ImpL